MGQKVEDHKDVVPRCFASQSCLPNRRSAACVAAARPQSCCFRGRGERDELVRDRIWRIWQLQGHASTGVGIGSVQHASCSTLIRPDGAAACGFRLARRAAGWPAQRARPTPPIRTWLVLGSSNALADRQFGTRLRPCSVIWLQEDLLVGLWARSEPSAEG